MDGDPVKIQNRRAYHRAYREKNYERVRAWEIAAKAKIDPEVKRAKGRAYYAANKDKVLATTRRGHLSKRYGLTPDALAEMRERQGGVCAICGEPPKGTSRITSVLHVDHDHQTGAVRSLLCMDCNVAIGRLRDRPDLCRLAACYLESFRKKEVHCG